MSRASNLDNISGSMLSRKYEARQHKISTTTARSLDQELHEDDDEDKSDKDVKSKRDFWSLADDCWHLYKFKDLLLVFLLFSYVVVTAMIMVILEENAQIQKRILYHKTMDEYWQVFADNMTRQLLNTSDLVVFVDSEISEKFDKKVRQELFRYHEGLITIYESKDTRQLDWDFWNATLYGLSLFTTIGYKHMYPITQEGKIATIVLATFGIPLLLTVIQHLALNMYQALTYILNAIIHFCKRKWSAAVFKKEKNANLPPASPKSDRPRVALPFSIGVFLLLIWIFTCPLTILLWEPEWAYFDAFYYFFISFTTVGLDYGAPVRLGYLYLVWLWAVIGLALLSLCFKILYSPRNRNPSIEHLDIGYKSASMAARTDSACIPSDWCISTMSLAERSIGASQLVKVGTPRLPRKKISTVTHLEESEDDKQKHKHKRRRFGDHRYELITDQGSGVLAGQEDVNSVWKSKDALDGMSDEYKHEFRWLSQLGRYSETQSLNEMTATDAMDEKRFIMATLRKQRQHDPNAQVHLAFSTGDTSSTTGTSSTFGTSSTSPAY